MHPADSSAMDQLNRALSAVSDISAGGSEVDCLLPAHGVAGQRKASKHAHHRSFSNTWQAFSVAMQPRKGDVELARQQETVDAEAAPEEPFFPETAVAETREWLRTAAIMLPKVSWGWLPFGFTFLGFGAAAKLLLFITVFAVYCSAIMTKLYNHTDQKTVTLADCGQEALGRFGRRLVDGLTMAINVLLPVIMHVGGMRYLQYFAFASTGICLPWISLLFGVAVIGLGQIQRLGRHPRLNSRVIPGLMVCAVGLTIAQLLLLKAEHAANPPPPPDEAGLVYISDYVMAVVCLVSANYFGQHCFLEDMSAMEHPASFQHATATAQVLTLLTNAAIGVASLHVPALRVTGFIAFAFTPTDWLPRSINCCMFLIMLLKYVVILNVQTRRLIPWLPHLMQQVVDPSGVETAATLIQPRQLWLLASSLVVAYSYLIANTFPHTFMGLSGLLTSVAFIPMAYTLPCLFSLNLLAHNTTALEYALQTSIIPVSLLASLAGIWASGYILIAKWHQFGESKGCWGCNAI